MRQALKEIEIYAPNVTPNGSFNKYGYTNAEGKQQYAFPVTDSCERSAALMGDDYVRLRFNLTAYVPMAAFSFIRYNGQTFFLMDDYRPQSNGSEKTYDADGNAVIVSNDYEYDVKFYSVANMLRKPICYRHVKVSRGAQISDGYYEWDEPEVSVSATLETMYVIIVESIEQYTSRLNSTFLFKRMLDTLVANGKHSTKPYTPGENVKLTANTELSTFSFNGEKIANVCTSVANQFSDEKKDTEWYIEEDATTHSLTLHFCKCDDEQSMNHADDFAYKNTDADRATRPVKRGGLAKVEYSRDTSSIPQLIVPYGAERNMTYQAVKGIDEASQMQSTFGKRLRLKTDHTCVIDGVTYPTDEMRAKGITGAYAVKDKNGNIVPLGIDSHGGIANDQVNTGEEKIEYFDDVYPQCHFVVSDVSVRTKRQDGMSIPEYTCEGKVVDSDGHEIQPEGEFYPIQIEEGTTLSVRFESGYLNGREFEIANKTQKKTDPSTGQPETNYTLRFTIVADGSIEDGTLIPSGNFKPNIGDKFALFNMKMPEAYITYAQEELAQKAYERLIEYQDTVPDVKCTSSPDDFSRFDMRFGTRFTINSEKIGFTTRDVVINGVTKTVRVPIDFISRVTAYSYKLTKVNEVQFTLSSALVRGTLADMAAAITNVSYATDGLGQRSINLSRRGWRDASEVADMISSVTTEMMLVGNAKYQFGYTSEVKPVHSNGAFVGLEVSYGQLQHTQEPYIGYANGGMWQIQPAIGDGKISVDVNGNPLDGTKPYYVFAICSTDNLEWAQIVLMDKEYADTNNIYRKDTDVDSENDSYPAYLLLGILSSEYAETKDGVSTNERVFSPTNGFTAIEGGTITTEQIQDANRRLIIDFSSNPPRIIAKRGAQIIGNITFISSDGAETSLANKMNSVDEELAKEIGGENLYAGVDPLNIITTRKDTDIILENGKKYVISVAAIDGDAWGLLAKEKIGSAYSDLGWIVKDGTIGTMQHYEKKTLVVTGHGGKLALQVTSSGSDYYYTLTGIMVQQGEKPTTYHAGYLAKALERDATKEVTSIDGGLLLSALIKLAQGGVVRAGMSGLADYGQKTIDGQTYQSEGVGFWAGSDYVDALNAACGIETNTLPPVFLSKTGYKSRIGCFRVVDKDTIAVVTGESTIYITNKNIDDVTVMQDSQSEYMDATILVDDDDPRQSGSDSVVSSITFNVAKSGKYAIYVPQTEIDAVSGVLSYPANPGVYPGQTDSGYASAVAYGSFYIRIKNNGTIIHSSSSKTVNTENQTDDGASQWREDTDSATIPSINLTKEITAGSLVVEIVGSYSVSASADENTSVHASGDARGEISFSIGDVVITGVEKYCVVAKDGMAIISNSNAAFYVRNSGTQLNVVAKGLPNRTNAMPGGLYVSNENVCVKPL